MRSREMKLLLLLTVLNIALVSFPLGMKNHRLREENRVLRGRSEQQRQEKGDFESEYTALDEIRSLVRDAGLIPTAEEVVLEGRIRYTLQFSPAEEERWSLFFSGLSQLPGSVRIAELSLPLRGEEEIRLVLEMGGGSYE